ncbi:glycosyltransferase [Paenibacillus lupini]|uniref:glycosyltransferase n=1 Tax=Paenibacillus lupini TaxID=1450204 RepID=UPI00141DD45E|nr:glycosyltransferase [Paenibacillus lupini]NIK23003.1 glycosyltransferase involved in cell wall biosynthesis [Paenibacillus lupini]
MKRLLWIGCLESDEEFKSKAEKGYSLASAQVSQQNILSGLEEVTGLVFDSINGSVLPPYPIYKDKIVKEVVWSHKEGAYDVSVGYKNRKYINRLTCKKEMIKAARKWVEELYQNEELIVFVYSMRSSVMAAACEVKKLIPSAKIFLIVTDLPQYMDLGQSKVKEFLKKIDWLQIKKMQKDFNGFILYASKMAEYLNIENEKWILMEGSFDTKELSFLERSNSTRALLYSGLIDKKYGLDRLINSFRTINEPDFELWITGGGKDSEYIREQAQEDSRIKYFGFLPSREDVLLKQQEATMLINMRLPDEAASAYCFPSKLFEYMASGTPVLTYKLDGIPDEYYQHLSIIKNNESLTESILNLLKMSEVDRDRLGAEARDFIKNNKNNISQAHRILKFVMRSEEWSYE